MLLNPLFWCILGFLLLTVTSTDHKGARYWREVAKDNIDKYLKLQPNTGKARNIVLMIGDGMGMSTITAARLLKGQMGNNFGEEQLNMEKLPYTGISKIYSTNRPVPDSAATVTALVTGVKTNTKVLGLDETVTPRECADFSNDKLYNIRHWCEEDGMVSGVVTTARITHATPAVLYAWTSNRDWENSNNIPNTTNATCTDIASQLINNGRDMRVILGGGLKHFIPNDTDYSTGGAFQADGDRLDDRNLIEEWKSEKLARDAKHQVVYNTQQIRNVHTDSTDYLFGLFNNDHMSYETDRDMGVNGEPSIAEMTRTAIEILNKHPRGFFLMVEGARIDHASHDTRAKKTLTDTLAFDDAVRTVMDMTNEGDTLIIVTADHSHTLSISGYAAWGVDVLDIAKDGSGKPLVGLDGLPYTTLMFANGPNEQHPRPNLTNVDTTNKEYQQNSVVELKSETHSGEDVPIYARGPMAHLLTGVKEQNVIAYVMAHSACVGDVGIACERGRPEDIVCSLANKCISTLFVPLMILFNMIFQTV